MSMPPPHAPPMLPEPRPLVGADQLLKLIVSSLNALILILMRLLRSVLQLPITIACELLLIPANIAAAGSSASARLRLPPGPKGWPLLGCLFQLKRCLASGEYEEMVDRFGRVFTLKVGSTPIIIITGAELVHEAFVEKGAVFASRVPQTAYSTDIVSANLTTVACSAYGPLWRALRRNLVSALIQSSGSRASYLKHVRQEVVEDVLRRFRDAAAGDRLHGAAGGSIVNVRPIIKHGFFSLLTSFCFGRQLEDSAIAHIAQVISGIVRVRSSFEILEFVPWLQYSPWIIQATKREQGLQQQLKSAILPLITDARRLHQDGKLPQGSYIHSLLTLPSIQLEAESERQLSDNDLVDLCHEIIVAGSDTTLGTLEWAMANIVVHPSVQAQMVKEIESVVGQRDVCEEDIPNLPYVEAVALETLRMHPPGYVTLPHTVTRPCTLQGYDIPVNAKIYANLWSISNDPRLWEDPSCFKPERFVVAGGDGRKSVSVDMTGSKSITMIPFGVGRRICPGMGLAMTNLCFLLSRLVQSFEWKPSQPDEVIDLTTVRHFTMVMKTPLKALISERRSLS